MNRYSEYKESGVEWLGVVPGHWAVKRIKEITTEISKGTTPSTEGFVFTDEGVRFIKAENIGYTKVVSETPNFYISQEANTALFRSQLKKNDLLLVIAGATIGKVGIVVDSLLPANTNQAVCFLRFIKQANIDFVYALFSSDYFSKYIWFSIVQSAQPNLAMGVLGNFKIFLPPLPEQTAIASYLDEKTALIDKKVAILEKKAEHYRTLKQSLINETVTRGLNKSAPMKDSGVEWIGEIPGHWEVKRLKENVVINPEVIPDSTNPDYEFDYVDIGSVTFGRQDVLIERMTYADAPSRARRIVRKGDTIISTVRTYLKAITFIADDVQDLIVSTGFAVVRPHSKHFNKYFSYMLTSNIIIDAIGSVSKGVSYPAINASTVDDLSTPLPPLEEQKSIADYLDEKTAQIDTITASIASQIATLKELRKSLINEVVTGKRKVC